MTFFDQRVNLAIKFERERASMEFEVLNTKLGGAPALPISNTVKSPDLSYGPVGKMTTYREFQEELQRLHMKAEATRRIEKAAALERIRALITDYQLSLEDLELSPKTTKTPGAVRYLDPVSGATWSGRGRPPKWLAGVDRARFAVS